MARTDREILVVAIDKDFAADNYVPLYRAPAACTVKSGYAFMTDAVAASTADYIKLGLCNGGTAGSGTTTMAAVIGGTAGWTALLPVAFTISAGALTVGQVMTLLYDEEGNPTPKPPIVIQFEVEYS